LSRKPGASSSRRKAPPSIRTRTRTRRAVLFLFSAFALRGIFLNLALPYGDPLDEIFHFGYAVFLEATGHPPAASEVSMPEQLLRPLRFLPRSTSFPGPKVSWSEASRWTPGERERRWREAFPPVSGERPVFVTANYESQQPPLFYLSAAVLLRALKEIPLETRLLILRLAATLAAASTVPIAHAFFRRLLPREGALLATAAWAVFPGLGSFVGRFSNDALALPVIAAVLLLFAETAAGRLSWKGAALLAALLALGCWTKLYVLLLVPAAPLAGLLAPRHRRRTVLLRALAACSIALLLLFPWILRQRVDTGDWLGLFASKQAASLGVSLSDRVQSLGSLFTPRFWIVFGRTFLWPGTWSAMGAPASVAVLLAVGVTLVFLCPILRRARRSSSRGRMARGPAVALVLFVAGQILYADTYAAVARVRGHAPSAGPDGWYLLALLPALLTLGCVFGGRIRGSILLTAWSIFLFCEWALTLAVLPAVYAGWTSPNGSNAPIRSWASILGSPLLALATYARVGLARAPLVVLAAILAAQLLALFAGVLLALRRRPVGQ
jgi:hypothetical protein